MYLPSSIGAYLCKLRCKVEGHISQAIFISAGLCFTKNGDTSNATKIYFALVSLVKI
jgi:hypothetical protein